MTPKTYAALVELLGPDANPDGLTREELAKVVRDELIDYFRPFEQVRTRSKARGQRVTKGVVLWDLFRTFFLTDSGVMTDDAKVLGRGVRVLAYQASELARLQLDSVWDAYDEVVAIKARESTVAPVATTERETGDGRA